MTGFSDYLENELLDHVFGNAAFSAPATLYIALSTADPLDDNSGLTEPVGSGYARLGITNNATNFPAAAGGVKSNGAAFEFPAANGGSWGLITHFAIMDAATGGNQIGYGALVAAKTINDGDIARFPAGDLDITLD